MTDHPDNTVATLDRALKETFTPDIFGTGLVQEDILRINYLPISMTGMVIHQPSREAPLNHNISRAITAHAVATILG